MRGVSVLVLVILHAYVILLVQLLLPISRVKESGVDG